jgi:hypothetical protein
MLPVPAGEPYHPDTFQGRIMRSALFCTFAALALTGTAHAQKAPKNLTHEDYVQMSDDLAYWDSQSYRYGKILAHAMKLRPDRRDTPLRELNISDNEVREVEAIAYHYLPRSLVNISPVVTECPCEEGPVCTAQVYIVATLKDKSRGLQLSRMNDRWQLGVVQEWWLRYQSIGRPNTGDSFLDFYLRKKAQSELLEEFPACASKHVPAQELATAKRSETTK